MPIIDPGPREWEPEEDGPCGLWPIDTECCPDWPEAACDWTSRHLLAVEIATDLLWRLTAGRYGLCAQLIRPCRRSKITPDWYQLDQASGRFLRPVNFGGRWFNIGCGCVADGCGCGPVEAVDLPGPVHEVVEVRVDGEPLSVGKWRLQRLGPRTKLLRTDGEGWPSVQDMTLPDTEPGTWSVLYLRGRKVPAAGVRAVSTLACEVLKQCRGEACRLPDRVKSVTREGISYAVYDPGEDLEKGLTGLREVDAWIRSVNPYGSSPAAVFTLDLPAAPEHQRGAWDRQ
ncbi:hypothetical protein [Streptomyces albidoflavus]|uniref:hypothetical protein n=1 Tax=Streptomyces albidoflavus TaxID=1886 RepID=UPI00101EBE30|nr:hypothetical protein [Streptomyces albidoflavus]RZF02822.1 hypothetical protein C0R05_31910 [Streptomyces albidoflavus]